MWQFFIYSILIGNVCIGIWTSARMKSFILLHLCARNKENLKLSLFQSIPSQLSTSWVFQSTEVLFSPVKSIHSVTLPRFWCECFSYLVFCFWWVIQHRNYLRIASQGTAKQVCVKRGCSAAGTIRICIFICLLQVRCLHGCFTFQTLKWAQITKQVVWQGRLPFLSHSISHKANLTKRQKEIWNSSPWYIVDERNVQGRIADKTAPLRMVLGCQFQ